MYGTVSNRSLQNRKALDRKPMRLRAYPL